MELSQILSNMVPSMQDVLSQGVLPSGATSPAKNFASILSKIVEKGSPNLVSGAETVDEPDFQTRRLELADQIKDAMRAGDPENRLPELHAAYQRIDDEARQVASRAFDAALARLSSPENDIASRIKMGRFAHDSHAAPVTTAKTTPENCPILPDTKDANANCIQIPGMKTAVPPQVDVDLATPERLLPTAPADQAPQLRAPERNMDLLRPQAPQLHSNLVPLTQIPLLPVEQLPASSTPDEAGVAFGEEPAANLYDPGFPVPSLLNAPPLDESADEPSFHLPNVPIASSPAPLGVSGSAPTAQNPINFGTFAPPAQVISLGNEMPVSAQATPSAQPSSSVPAKVEVAPTSTAPIGPATTPAVGMPKVIAEGTPGIASHHHSPTHGKP